MSAAVLWPRRSLFAKFCDMNRPAPENGYQAAHARLLLSSFRRFVGRELIHEGPDAQQRLFEAPFVVVSHGVQEDPVLNYGNEAALKLWETDWASLTAMPSRLTAEPVHRDERARLLRQAAENGFIDNYEGVRISASGRRFLIRNAIIWNLVDEAGAAAGQAATFSDVTFL